MIAMIKRGMNPPRVLKLGTHAGGCVVVGVVVDGDDPAPQPRKENSVAAKQPRRIPRRQARQSQPRSPPKRECDGAERTKPQHQYLDHSDLRNQRISWKSNRAAGTSPTSRRSPQCSQRTRSVKPGPACGPDRSRDARRWHEKQAEQHGRCSSATRPAPRVTVAVSPTRDARNSATPISQSRREMALVRHSAWLTHRSTHSPVICGVAALIRFQDYPRDREHQPGQLRLAVPSDTSSGMGSELWASRVAASVSAKAARCGLNQRHQRGRRRQGQHQLVSADRLHQAADAAHELCRGHRGEIRGAKRRPWRGASLR